MSMVLPNEGKVEALSRALYSTPEALVLKLFKTNIAPVAATVAGDFTEANFTGYSLTTNKLDASNAAGKWGAPVITSDVAYSTYATTITFTITGGADQTVYGWYLVGFSSGKCYAAYNFGAKLLTVAGGDSATIVPKIGWGQL